MLRTKEYIKEYDAKRNDYIKQQAIQSVIAGKIINIKKWNQFCSQKRRSAKNNNIPYPEDFTNDMIFNLLVNKCYYCQDIATTIDRVDSSIGYVSDNRVGSCHSCNISKGNGDINSFLRKSYYRSRGEYFDEDTDLWSDNIRRPCYSSCKKKAVRQGVVFTLTKKEWDELTEEDCSYCKRSLPIKRWNGVDRVVPHVGYTIQNTVSCCGECNNDKGKNSPESTKLRNDNIAKRIECCDIVVKSSAKKLRDYGANNKTRKVCVYGNVYNTQFIASLAIGKNATYVSRCISDGRYPNDIFNISEEFYDFMVEYKFINITKKMYTLFDRF
jgi:hypothetical protein